MRTFSGADICSRRCGELGDIRLGAGEEALLRTRARSSRSNRPASEPNQMNRTACRNDKGAFMNMGANAIEAWDRSLLACCSGHWDRDATCFRTSVPPL
jgi:hypothetical protein